LLPFENMQLLLYILMKPPKIVSIVLLLVMAFSVFSQDNAITPERTPEQEAIKQTEKLQQELNLTTEQAKRIYDINLRYARERQISNRRSEAVERMKNKNTEIQNVLSQEQNEKLQSKRSERSTVESSGVSQNRPVNATFHTNQDVRTNQSVRIPTDAPVRANFRPSPSIQPQPTQNGGTVPQAVRRSTTVESQNQPVRSNPSSVRPSVQTPVSVPGSSENQTNTIRK